METKTYLFIGGCADGQRIRVKADYRAIEVHPDQFRRRDEPRSPGQPFRKLAVQQPEVYEAMDFSGGGDHRATIYVKAGMSSTAALDLLVAGYRTAEA